MSSMSRRWESMERQTGAVNRRKFLAATGLGAVSLGVPNMVGATELTETEEANIKVVNRFLHVRWNVTPIDYDELTQILADDCVRGGTNPRNLEDGREAILDSLRARDGDGLPTRFTYVVQQWACGSIVAHERYEGSGVGRDGGPPRVGHGVGVFQVRDGKITEWRWFGIELRPGLEIPAGAFKP